MIEEQATVIECEGKYVWVETQRQSSCGHCSVKNGCGTQVLSKVLGNKVARVRCLNVQEKKTGQSFCQLKSGDRVVIGLQESALLSGSLLIYFLPLMAMILCGGLAVFAAGIWWPEGTDLLSAIASFTGLFLGLYLARNYSQNKYSPQYEPVIIKKLPVSEWPLKQNLLA
ncbi:MAG: SoxR reducing system RseC family protein [Gammaproteobacteria bacterium]|nr:SoxR reducing system RseC family protein [Gammaproteobacteria bacterium]